MKEPARFPRIQHEAIVRLLAADLVGEEAVLDGLRALREEIADISARLDAAEAIATTIPSREHYCCSTTAWRAPSSRPTATGSSRSSGSSSDEPVDLGRADSEPERNAEAHRRRLREAAARRAEALRAVEHADKALADRAIEAGKVLPVKKIAADAGSKTQRAVYKLIDWRTGKRGSRH